MGRGGEQGSLAVKMTLARGGHTWSQALPVWPPWSEMHRCRVVDRNGGRKGWQQDLSPTSFLPEVSGPWQCSPLHQHVSSLTLPPECSRCHLPMGPGRGAAWLWPPLQHFCPSWETLWHFPAPETEVAAPAARPALALLPWAKAPAPGLGDPGPGLGICRAWEQMGPRDPSSCPSMFRKGGRGRYATEQPGVEGSQPQL